MELLDYKNLGFSEISWYDNGICHIHYLQASAATLEQIKLIVVTRNEMTQHQPVGLLSDAKDKFLVPTSEALQFLHSDTRIKTTLAHAYIIKSLPQQLAINSSTILKKFSMPTKGFRTKDLAIEWLLTFIDHRN